jgi:hypothetical protein
MAFPSLPAIVLMAVLFLHIAFRRLRLRPISNLPGPLPGSWLVGEPAAVLQEKISSLRLTRVF